jgi:hypothetical protein
MRFSAHVADDQPGLSAADDDRVDPLAHEAESLERALDLR